jgi:hypothetical protein
MLQLFTVIVRVALNTSESHFEKITKLTETYGDCKKVCTLHTVTVSTPESNFHRN